MVVEGGPDGWSVISVDVRVPAVALGDDFGVDGTRAVVVAVGVAVASDVSGSVDDASSGGSWRTVVAGDEAVPAEGDAVVVGCVVDS